jgi:hypothetical protein
MLVGRAGRVAGEEATRPSAGGLPMAATRCTL